MNALAGGHWPSARSATLDWLIHDTRTEPFLDVIFGKLCQRLVAEGVPLARATLHVRTLHPQYYGARMLWEPGRDEVELWPIEHSMVDDPRYHRNPLRALDEGAEAIRRRLDVTTPESDEYSIYADLREQGVTDYVALPLTTSDGRKHAATWATAQPGGFTTRELGRVYDLLPALALVAEIRLNRRIAKNLLTTYVGRSAGEHVLSGEIVRGSGSTVQAAIWNCDLRSFTMISERWPRDDVISSLNDYFDAMGGPVERHGGEILKFIGDGMLAIFPLAEEGACARALRAAIEAKAAMAALNERRAAVGQELLGYGLALHVGEVMYGNIGTATRLDFTVIGPAVNTAARLEGLTKQFRRHIVISAPFAYQCGCSPDFLEPLGAFPLRGVGASLDVFGVLGDHYAGDR